MKRLFLGALALAAGAAHAAPERLVAVGGAVNEIIYALGAEELLVGNCVSSYYPPEALKLPKVGYQRMLPAEGILSLNPDLVILTDKAGPPAVIQQLECTGVDVLKVPAAESFEGVLETVQVIGSQLERTEQAEELIARLKTEKAILDAELEQQESAPKVLFILTHGGAPSVGGAGTAADAMIALSGGENVATAFNGYKPLSPEELIELAPEYVLSSKSGVGPGGSTEAILKIPGVALTPAGKKNQIIMMDSLLLLGFGPRTVEAALQLHNAYD
ncbi:ABC transporter substrate-binding protein [Pontiellaceae bacterium B12219]|nr:ABC transporter substrate-binding protein [Pontiellaceae bacterium B12219]